MSEEILKRMVKFVTNRIICKILEVKPRHSIWIEKIFIDNFGSEQTEKLRKIVSSNGSRNPWEEISRIFGEIKYSKRGLFYLKHRRRNTSAHTYVTTDDLSIDDYRQKIFSEILRIMLDCDLSDVNSKGQNGNNVLHLVVSLPTETEKDLKLKIELLDFLITASADCSLQNAQGMSPLHIIAGNYLFDPHNAYAMLQTPGLTNEFNTNGRLRILKILEPFLKIPNLERGQNGNSILHEWVIYCSMVEKLSTGEQEIGEFIISQAKVPLHLANDFSCTALHYAFTTDLLVFLCQHKSKHDSSRLDSYGDPPFLHILKHGILRRFASIVDTFTKDDFEKALEEKMGVRFLNRKPFVSNKTPYLDYYQDIFKFHGFKIHELGAEGKNCLDYVLLFTKTLSTHCKETLHLIEDNFFRVILGWVEDLTKTGGPFGSANCRECAISSLIYVLFEVGLDRKSTEKLLVDCIGRLFEYGADPNKINYPSKGSVIRYCCAGNLSEKSSKKQIIELLCVNGAHTTLCTDDVELQQIIKNTNPKQQVKVSIQSVKYSRELDALSREVHPERINDSTALRFHRTPIARGAIAVVFLAISEKDKRELALKRIDKFRFTKKVNAEIEALTSLEQNSNVINLYGIEETKESYYLKIELMDGDLKDLVIGQKTKLADQELVRKLAADMLRGLEYLHKKNMIHRDIKPGNILYREKPELILKLADFDLTKHFNPSGYDQLSMVTTNSSSLCGTRGWMAPELITRKVKSLGKETDMFALGLVFHFLFSKGFHPFHSQEESLLQALSTDSFQAHKLESGISENIIQIHLALSHEQTHLVKMLLENDPRARPVSDGLLKTQCYFWTNLKKVEFLCKVGDQPEVTYPSKDPDFESKLNNSEFGRSVVNGWDNSLSADLYKDMSKKRAYNPSSVVELIKFFRNAYAHYEEKGPEIRRDILNDSIFKVFPKFVLAVWTAIRSQGWDKPGSGRDKLLRVLNEMD